MRNVEVSLRGLGFTYISHEVKSYDKLKEHWNDRLLSFYALEEDETLSEDLIQFDAILDDVEVVLWNGDDEVDITDITDITKEKGKYLKTKEYYSKMIGKGDYVCGGYEVRYDMHFIIELEDDEEFNPKKLQLIKSDYELDFLPYSIVVDTLYYDGKIVYTDSDYDIPTPDRDCFQQIIEYDLPYQK